MTTTNGAAPMAETMTFRPQLESEPDWLYGLRAAAWNHYSTQPLPDRVRHLWRYTDPQAFLPEATFEFNLQETIDATTVKDVSLPDDRAALAIASPAAFAAVLSDEARQAGVLLTTLEDAAREHPDLLTEHLDSLLGDDAEKFEAFNLAASRVGVVLIVPRNTELRDPIHIRRMVGNGLFPTRLLAIVGENAEVTVLDEYTGSDDFSGSINSVVELRAEDASRVRWVTLTSLADHQKLYLTQRNRIGRDVDLRSGGLSIDAGLAKINWATELAGRGATSRWSGLLLGDGEQHIDTHTRHRHTASESWSDLTYKVALRDKAMSAYTGLIAIDEHAVNCEAYQENRNLLLSREAHVESIPELEIINDDVKCSHGVTVGPLEEEQLFYFESRGIARAEAMRIILAGYFEEILGTLPEALIEFGRNALLTKLNGDLD